MKRSASWAKNNNNNNSGTDLPAGNLSNMNQTWYRMTEHSRSNNKAELILETIMELEYSPFRCVAHYSTQQ